jgi:hypothetical protein
MCLLPEPAFAIKRFGPLLLLMTMIMAATGDAAPADSTLGDLTREAVETHQVPAGTERLQLFNSFVIPQSVMVTSGTDTLSPGADYRVSGDRGRIFLAKSIVSTQSPGGDTLYRIRYVYRPVLLGKETVLHEFRTTPPQAEELAARIHEADSDEDDTSGDLDVRGSKSVRMASGNRRELRVDQNLRLDISGMLTEDIRVSAHLSDDDLPVIPEGSTEELRDVDRVHVDITAPQWQATLGDITAQRGGTVFGNYKRKIQGVSIRAGQRRGVAVLAGTPRGRYRDLQLRGEESNQGPYYLGGGDAGVNLLIVAGSEKVFLNGEPMTRGSDKDYTIDYVRGTVTFTYRRLITAESEILVEFEEGEGEYTRTTSGIEGWAIEAVPGFDDLDLAVTARLIVEEDDPDRRGGEGLSDEQRQVLANAGDDVSLAVEGGMQTVAAGQGDYRLETIDGFRAAVYDTVSGDHLIEFYHVGYGYGDYAVLALTPAGDRIFEYKGEGLGSYQIGRPVPLPSRRQLFTLRTSLGDSSQAGLDFEFNSGIDDANTLSDLDNQDNTARAIHARLRSGNRQVNAFGRELMRLALLVEHADRQADFQPFQLDRDQFRYDQWGLGARAGSEDFLRERDAETTVRGSMSIGDAGRGLSLGSEYGHLEHGADLSADRAGATGRWTLSRLRGQHTFQTARAEDPLSGLDIDREQLANQASVDLSWLILHGRADREQYLNNLAAADITAGSRNRSWQYGLSSTPQQIYAWDVSFTRGLADSSRGGRWRTERDSRTGKGSLGTPEYLGMRLTADGTVRDVKTAGGGLLRTRLMKLNLAGRWEQAGSDWNLQYGVDNSRTEVMDRQIVYIGERQGDYNQVGEFVGYQLGDFQVVTVGTDSLVATTEAVADLNWRQDFGFLGRDRAWGAWNSLSRVSVRSRSLLSDTSRLMRFAEGTLFDPVNTVLGEFGWRQEFNLLRHLRSWDLRLVSDMNQSLDRQYALHPESKLRRVYQVQVSRNIGVRTTLRWRFNRTSDRRRTEEADYSANRPFDTVDLMNQLEWQYRASRSSSFSLSVIHDRREDTVSAVEQDEIGARLNLRQRVHQKLSLLVDAAVSDVNNRAQGSGVQPFFFPYPGTNVENNLRLSWESTEMITTSLIYGGRRQGERGWQHDFRLEATARF